MNIAAQCQRKLGALRCSDAAMTAPLRSPSSPVLRCSRATDRLTDNKHALRPTIRKETDSPTTELLHINLSTESDQAQATISNFEELAKRIGERHESAGANRFKDEAYLAEFEHRLHADGQPKIPNQALIGFRQAGYGLNVESELYEIWRQCIAMFHARPAAQIPEAVKLIVGGVPDESVATLMHSVAVLLEDDSPFRRLKKFPIDKHLDLKAQVIRQWVAANGITAQQTLEAVDRLIVQDTDHQLTREPAESFLPLATSMLKKATELAKAVGKTDDKRFAFYVFRCLQRIAAYAVRGRVQWRAEWLRGTKTNARAIAGTSKMQAELGSLLREHVLQIETGHSGAKATATTYRLRFEIPAGPMNHHEASRELGLHLDSKGVPKK